MYSAWAVTIIPATCLIIGWYRVVVGRQEGSSVLGNTRCSTALRSLLHGMGKRTRKSIVESRGRDAVSWRFFGTMNEFLLRTRLLAPSEHLIPLSITLNDSSTDGGRRPQGVITWVIARSLLIVVRRSISGIPELKLLDNPLDPRIRVIVGWIAGVGL